MIEALERCLMPGHTYGEDPYLDFLLAEAAWEIVSTSNVDVMEKHRYQLLLIKAKTIITKVCWTCDTAKPLDEFTKSATHGQCKQCFAEYHAKYRRNSKSYAPVTEGDKHCKRCDTTKPVAEFGRNKKNKDGLHIYCKPCACAQVRASQKRRYK